MILHLETEANGELRQRIEIGEQVLFSDVDAALGGSDSAPDPHGLFDASLAACKAITVMMYAKQRQIDLQRISLQINRDSSQERTGQYQLNVTIGLIGNLSDAERQKLLLIADKCPIHKLMTQATITIHTALAE